MTWRERWAEGPEDVPNVIPRQVGLCIGCDQYERLNEYEITLDDGSTERVQYCAGCAEAATTPQAPQILTCTPVAT